MGAYMRPLSNELRVGVHIMAKIRSEQAPSSSKWSSAPVWKDGRLILSGSSGWGLLFVPSRPLLDKQFFCDALFYKKIMTMAVVGLVWGEYMDDKGVQWLQWKPWTSSIDAWPRHNHRWWLWSAEWPLNEVVWLHNIKINVCSCAR